MSIFKNVSSRQIPVWKVRVPIRIKITIPYLILSLVLAVVAAYLITQVVIENVEERFNKQLYEAGKISSELIVTYETQLLQTQRLLSNTEGVSGAVQTNDPTTLRTLTFGIILNDGQEAVEFFNLHGSHVLSIRHHFGTNPEDYEFSTGGQTEFTQLEIVQNVLAQKIDERGDKFADLVQTDSGYFLYISGPIYDSNGELAGVVLVGRSLSTVAADMRAKTFAQITFYDELGRVIYSTLPSPPNLEPELAVRTVLLKDISSTKRDISSQRDFDVANIPFSEILGAWEVRGNHDLGVLGIALSQTPILQSLTNSRGQIFILVFIAVTLIILVGVNLANAITRPLLQLVQASVRVSQGDLSVRITPHTNDEISTLTHSFNTMVENLHTSKKELLNAYDNTLEGWVKALELRDKETQGHSERVIELTIRLAVEMGVHWETLINIRRGALLHDIGKMGVPDAILRKEEKLSEEEMMVIRNHPQFAYDMLKEIDYLQSALEIPYCHHEKWDGTGYPRGLKGEEIPLAARIFSIVDVWDAMTSDRPYRKAIPREEVISHLIEQKGRHFDPNVVDVFVRILRAPGKGNE
ncbi:Cyclic di-GMP phosphodiesterase [Anaerolineales bacterium]|nr:Cyclic di-GMP phosphodiesterase [Anaerolineales bacterium]